MNMLQAIKIRIYPDRNQINLFNKLFGCYRFTYNHCLTYKKENYEKDKTSISRNDLCKYFHADLVKEYEFLQEFNSNILKNSIQVLYKTYQSFFKQHTGYPTFKSKHDKQSIMFIKPTRGMLKNHKLAKSIQDLSLHEVKRQLEYKCKLYKRDLVKIDRWFPSSKKCNVCSYINKKLTLKDREWICPECGTKHDRDFNASVNIENEGKRILIGMWNPEFKLVDCPTKERSNSFMDDINSNVVLKSSGSVKQEQHKSLLTTIF